MAGTAIPLSGCDYAQEKRTLEIGLWLNTLEQSGRVLREYDDKIVVARTQHEAAEQELLDIDAQVEANFSNSNACSAKADEIRQQAAGLEENAAKKDSEALVLQNDILHNKENMERIRREIEQSAQSGQDMDREIGEKQNEIEQKKHYIEEKNKESAALNNRLEQIRQGMSESDAAIEDFNLKISSLSTEATEAKMAEMTSSSSISEIELRLSSVHETIGTKQKQQLELKAASDDFAKMLSDTDERIQ